MRCATTTPACRFADGVSIRALADYLGHTDHGFTLRVYTHLMPADEDRARQAIDAAFRSREPGVSQAAT
jgi:integrase